MNQIEQELAGLGVETLLTALVELNRQALGGDETQRFLHSAAEAVVAGLAVEFCSLWELRGDNSLLLRTGVGWREGRVGQQVERNTCTPALRAVLSCEPVLIGDLPGDRRFSEPSLLTEHGVVSSLNVPIHGPAKLFGVLGAHTAARREFLPAEIKALQLIAQAISISFLCRGDTRLDRQSFWLRAEQMMSLGQVAAGMAHELRNPLTSIKGLIQVNQREFAERGFPTRDIQIIEQEVRRMERALETFLDFARPPRPDRHRIDLAPLIERVAALVGGRAKRQRVSIDFTPPEQPLEAEVDSDQIQQLLLNLLLNALDAMPAGGNVCIDLRRAVDGAVELEVADTGPGIAPPILPVVFDTFVTDKESGVGLGLPVSRRIAEDHGGSLTAQNVPGGGARFLLTLPVAGTAL